MNILQHKAMLHRQYIHSQSTLYDFVRVNFYLIKYFYPATFHWSACAKPGMWAVMDLFVNSILEPFRQCGIFFLHIIGTSPYKKNISPWKYIIQQTSEGIWPSYIFLHETNIRLFLFTWNLGNFSSNFCLPHI